MLQSIYARALGVSNTAVATAEVEVSVALRCPALTLWWQEAVLIIESVADPRSTGQMQGHSKRISSAKPGTAAGKVACPAQLWEYTGRARSQAGIPVGETSRPSAAVCATPRLRTSPRSCGNARTILYQTKTDFLVFFDARQPPSIISVNRRPKRLANVRLIGCRAMLLHGLLKKIDI